MDETGRLDWLRQDLQGLRAEMRAEFEGLRQELRSRDARLDDHDKRLDALERDSYAQARLWQRVAFVIGPALGALFGWLISWLPRKG